MPDLSVIEWIAVCSIFVWSGFVRSGMGFGGAALALPLMLLIVDNPLLWLPMVAIHLLFFSAITVYDQLDQVNWTYLRKSLWVIMVPKLIGVFGLISLPNQLLVLMIYSITFAYGLTYLFNYQFSSHSKVVDFVLLIIGGYASGVTLMGAPLLSAVYARNIAMEQLRVSLFVLWIVLVSIKVGTFVVFEVDLQIKWVLYFLPFVAIGHWLGLKIHLKLIQDGGAQYKRVLGGMLLLICGYGLVQAIS